MGASGRRVTRVVSRESSRFNQKTERKTEEADQLAKTTAKLQIPKTMNVLSPLPLDENVRAATPGAIRISTAKHLNEMLTTCASLSEEYKAFLPFTKGIRIAEPAIYSKRSLNDEVGCALEK